jgi:hypothetical protein
VVEVVAVGDPEHLQDVQGQEVAGEGEKAVVRDAEEEN